MRNRIIIDEYSSGASFTTEKLQQHGIHDMDK